jgi:hypothetical protein
MLADDAASLEFLPTGVAVAPCEQDHWLTPDSCVALDIPLARGSRVYKRHMRASSVAREPCPLGLVVALRFDASVATPVLRPLRGSEAARLLLEGVIRFDLEDGHARRREFEQVTAVYNGAPFVELVRPLSGPGGVAAFVMDALGRRKS